MHVDFELVVLWRLFVSVGNVSTCSTMRLSVGISFYSPSPFNSRVSVIDLIFKFSPF